MIPQIATQPAEKKSLRGMAFKRRTTGNLQKVLLLVLCAMFFQTAVEGSIISPASGKAAFPKFIDFKGNEIVISKFEGKTLLLFFNPYSSISKKSLFYSQQLYRRYQKSGLVVVGISKDVLEKDELLQFSKQLGLTFPLVLDVKNKIHRSFEAADCCGATVFLNGEQLKHDFKVNLLPEQLRQLVEKEMKGNIDYDLKEVEQRVFLMGKKAHSLPLFHLDTSKQISLLKILEKINIQYSLFFLPCALCVEPVNACGH